MPLSNFHELSNSDYTSARNEQIKLFENPNLAFGRITHSSLHEVDGNLAIGYGWDIDEQDAQTTINNFAQTGLALSADEIAALHAYKSPGSSRAEFESAWANVALDEAEATTLLNVSVEAWEAGVSATLGASDMLDVSRFCAAPSARLGHFPFECDRTFPPQC